MDNNDHDLLIRLVERHEAVHLSVRGFGERLGTMEQESRLHTQDLSGLRERLRQTEEQLRRQDIDVDVLRKQFDQELANSVETLQQRIDQMERTISRRETQLQVIVWLGLPLVGLVSSLLTAYLQNLFIP